ncbi:hypothetical protein F3Y22_tig00111005pilonHSYRG00173 [Hibiscus syriacus]|uniref:DUF4283 domain-containing protein n=1 Tax=Hibiscus syriacus TaxID=106335 RepID=A0A6A2Z8T5_HIBSY|nr:hypothetical protein F3Y22_tig00111005pilonHSYRG00173 [Hibiscus syriacus]
MMDLLFMVCGLTDYRVRGLDLGEFLPLGVSVEGGLYVLTEVRLGFLRADWYRRRLRRLFLRLGKSPILSVFQKTVNKLWGQEGSIEILFLAPSVYILNFPSKRVRDWVLESGPWHIQQKVLVLRKWMPGMLHDVLSLDSTPVWIKLWHVPLELYLQKGLEYIASAIGRPLYLDCATTLKQQLNFDKICVNIDAKIEISGSVMVGLGEVNMVDVGVELVWALSRCGHCNIFGHLGDQCVKKDVDVDSICGLIGMGGSGCNTPDPDTTLRLNSISTLPAVPILLFYGTDTYFGIDTILALWKFIFNCSIDTLSLGMNVSVSQFDGGVVVNLVGSSKKSFTIVFRNVGVGKGKCGGMNKKKHGRGVLKGGVSPPHDDYDLEH